MPITVSDIVDVYSNAIKTRLAFGGSTFLASGKKKIKNGSRSLLEGLTDLIISGICVFDYFI